MFNNIVTYHVHRQDPLPVNNALGYQYIVAATGIYLRAEDKFFDILLPLARCPIRSLAPLQPYFRLRVSRLPTRLLAAVLHNARRVSGTNGRLREALYHFHHDGARVRVVKPPQIATTASVVAVEGNTTGVILDLHSHGNMGAFWSGTDDGDEQGFRVYGVIGRLDTKPEIRLRLGVYGYWFPLPIHMLFDGSGGFVDVLSQKMPRGTCHAEA